MDTEEDRNNILQLLNLYKKTGQLEYRDQVVIRCKKIVEGVSKIFALGGLNPFEDFKDLRQEAYLVVLNCCENFNSNRNPNFFAYITFILKCKLQEWFSNQKLIKLGGRDRKSLIYKQMPRCHSEILKLSEDTGVPYKKVLQFAQKIETFEDYEDENNPEAMILSLELFTWLELKLNMLSEKHLTMLLNDQNLKQSRDTINTTNLRSRKKLINEAIKDRLIVQR